MATTYKGVAATNLARTIPVLVEQGQFGGKVRRMYDTFVLTADLAANDIIVINGLLPEGARLVNCSLVTGALGGSCAISVGWQASLDINPPGGSGAGGEVINAADTTGFFNNFVVSSAQRVTAFGQSVASGGSGDFYQTVLTSEVQPIVTCNVASSSATGKSITVEIEYVVD